MGYVRFLDVNAKKMCNTCYTLLLSDNFRVTVYGNESEFSFVPRAYTDDGEKYHAVIDMTVGKRRLMLKLCEAFKNSYTA